MSVAGTALGRVARGAARLSRGAQRQSACADRRGRASAAMNVRARFPSLIWGVMFVAAVGFGPLPGVLALATHSAGMLGKLFAEVLEHIDPNPGAALKRRASRNSRIVRFAILPQATPRLSTRCSTVSSTICARRRRWGWSAPAGSGLQIVTAFHLFEYREASALVRRAARPGVVRQRARRTTAAALSVARLKPASEASGSALASLTPSVDLDSDRPPPGARISATHPQRRRRGGQHCAHLFEHVVDVAHMRVLDRKNLLRVHAHGGEIGEAEREQQRATVERLDPLGQRIDAGSVVVLHVRPSRSPCRRPAPSSPCGRTARCRRTHDRSRVDVVERSLLGGGEIGVDAHAELLVNIATRR